MGIAPRSQINKGRLRVHNQPIHMQMLRSTAHASSEVRRASTKYLNREVQEIIVGHGRFLGENGSGTQRSGPSPALDGTGGGDAGPDPRPSFHSVASPSMRGAESADEDPSNRPRKSSDRLIFRISRALALACTTRCWPTVGSPVY